MDYDLERELRFIKGLGTYGSNKPRIDLLKGYKLSLQYVPHSPSKEVLENYLNHEIEGETK